MSLVSGIVVFFLVWWTVIFCVLPWGNKAPETPEKGMAGSAPKNPRLKQKFIATTLLTIIIWLIVYVLVDAGLFSFADYAREMSLEDAKK